MTGFWRSKTTWLAIGTVLLQAGLYLTGQCNFEQAVQACITACAGAFLRDALRAHADHVAISTSAAGVTLAAHEDGGEA